MKRTFKLNLQNKPLSALLISPLAAAILSFSTPAFSAPGLVDIYQMAVLHDAKLAQAKANYEASQQVTSLSKAPLLPQVSANASYVLNDSSIDTADNNARTVGISASQSLYKHDSWANYDKAKFQLKQADYEVQAAEQDVIVRVADAYFKVLLAQEDVTLAKTQEKADKTQWERASASADVGLANKTDVLQAKSSFDLSKSQRISAENNLDVAFEELMKLTGKPVESLKVVKPTIALPSKNLKMQVWEQKAQDQNLDVLKVTEAANVALKEIDVQKSGHWVNVDVRASYNDIGYSGTSSSAAFTDGSTLSVGIYATMPLYSGGGTTAAVSQARASYKAANIGIRDAKEAARLNARIQVRNIERGLELVAANRAAVESNNAFLEAAEEGYKVGLRNLLEVLTARTNMFQARRNLVESLHNVVLSKLKLEATVGDLNGTKLTEYEQYLSDASVR